VQTGHDPAELAQITSRTDTLQSAIWGHVSAIVRERPNPISASLMAALNEVFDMTTAGRFSFELRLPGPIFWMLLGLTLLGMGVLGYQMGLRERRIRMLAAILALSWTVVIVVILDLAAARIGNRAPASPLTNGRFKASKERSRFRHCLSNSRRDTTPGQRKAKRGLFI